MPATAQADATAMSVSNDALLRFMHEYERRKLVCDQANGELRRHVKQGKSDGVDTDAAIAACRRAKRGGPAVKLYMQNHVRSLALLHMPVSQADLFGGWDMAISAQAKQADDVWIAETKGYHAGRNGTDIAECPYDAGSELFAAWHREWHRGQAAIARELAPDTHQASATRARPQRGKRQESLPGTESPPPAAPPRATRRGRGNGAAHAVN